MSFKFARFVCPLVLLLATGAAQAEMAPFPSAKPESMGLSPERLQRLDAHLHKLINTKQYAGLVTLLARHGKVVHSAVLGQRDPATNDPMKRDSIFYMGSQSKMVPAIAMMILYEEGKWRPEESIAKYIPEFAKLKVLKSIDKDGKMTLEDPQHPPTLDELMSMTAGFTYALRADANPIDKMYAERKVLQSASLQEMIEKLADIPLLYQPGTRWVYGASADVQGYLIEKFSGMTVPEFARKRIFEPLGMTSSGFSVSKENLPRLVKIYSMNAKGELAHTPMPGPEGTPPNIVTGGGGLYTTADDFLRMAQMLANGGELNGVRILAPSTVKLMSSNRLSDKLMANGKFGLQAQLLPSGMVLPDNVRNLDAFGLAYFRPQPGLGYAYNMAVIYDPITLGSTSGPGTIYWGGAFGTWFWADPVNGLTFIGMVQRGDLGVQTDLKSITQTLALQALVAPGK